MIIKSFLQQNKQIKICFLEDYFASYLRVVFSYNKMNPPKSRLLIQKPLTWKEE